MGNWRVTVIDQHRKRGMDPVFRVREEPFAARDDLVIGGRTGAITCTDTTGRLRWTHPVPGTPNAAHISSGRVLVTTSSIGYHAWGHLGPAYLLDLEDGTLVAELRGERGATLGGGRFLLGLEGYAHFHTWQFDRDGDVTDTWRSYGHYVVGTGIRVVEADRATPTASRVVRLLPGGAIERSALLLTESQACGPVVLPDGTILVLDAGVLRAFGRDLADATLAELVTVPDGEADRFTSTLERTGADRLTAVIRERNPERAGKYLTHTWTLALHRS
ncbi:hypothetical protein PUR71_37565 [Streptomyces sp. SP17BM10]|uniref:hypothetical protein n=1 Tax=Streptomyces sp. SP17BM10 TaxID=3002530 RepID=UPI002E765E25|nr:hypothetical protein [Streptomyces sp. SP17BM10]MEE1788569.1 hypothetical protein [Streptomyces sp. SP17BM10]